MDFKVWTDYLKAAQLVTDCGYYGTVEPADLAGTELYALAENDEDLVACIMVIRSGAQAYVDYLVVRQDCRGQGLALLLTDCVAHVLYKQKVRLVHSCVSGENGASAKMLMKYGAKIGWPYINGLVRLEDSNGNAED